MGYTHSAAGIASVVSHAELLERERLMSVRHRLGLTGQTAFIGGVSPHDDYLYAAPVYVHVYPYIKAKHVLMIGVAHKARLFPKVWGKLVFDSFDLWHGPSGPVAASVLRQDLLRALSRTDAVVHDRLQAMEHSVEGMVPFLQHYNRGARIVSIMVPYMSWPRLHELAQKAARALVAAMTRRRLALGRDVAVLISSDMVHYGDQGWGGKGFADFGVDRAGYQKAVARDLSLIREHLTGSVSPVRLMGLYHKLVKDDFHSYRITWCGRFSVPFGVALLSGIASGFGLGPVNGFLLRYGTTLDPKRAGPRAPDSRVPGSRAPVPRAPVPRAPGLRAPGLRVPGLRVPGLGVTAPANLRHWVGFAALGYLARPKP